MPTELENLTRILKLCREVNETIRETNELARDVARELARGARELSRQHAASVGQQTELVEHRLQNTDLPAAHRQLLENIRRELETTRQLDAERMDT